MDLTAVFGSKAQTKFVQYLLEHPTKATTQGFAAKMLRVSPSTVARVIEPLRKEGIIVLDEVKQMKVIFLNTESEKVKALLNFYQQVKRM